MKFTVLLVVCVAVSAQAAVTPQRMYKDIIPGAPAPRTGKIVNGEQAKRGQFPHQAAVLSDNSAFCGGSLISANWVMTAAHCASGFRQFSVTLGQQSQSAEEDGKITLTSTDKIVHADYDPFLISSDIALIKLPTSVTPSQWIKVVNLPSDASDDYNTDDVTASGWGLTSGGGSLPDQLQFVNLNVISNSECDEFYGDGSTDDTMICCGAPGGISTCNGDSGGPLILRGGSSPVQIGIVSWVSGAGCASGYPSGYVRVTTFLEWIAANSDVIIN